MELGFQAGGQILDRLGLGQPRGALDQQVAVGEQGDQQAFDQLFLAEDLAGEVLAQGDQRVTMGHVGARQGMAGFLGRTGYQL
ncbi:hypothetical protein D9M71_211870 [compost metagenome]